MEIDIKAKYLMIFGFGVTTLGIGIMLAIWIKTFYG